MDDYKYASVRRNVMKQKQYLGVSTHPRVCGFASKNIYKICIDEDGTKETVETYWHFTNKEK